MKKSSPYFRKSLLIKNKAFKWISLITLYLLLIAFVVFVAFLIKESVLGFQKFGLKKVFFSKHFNFQAPDPEVSVWFPIAITLFISLFALIIALPIGVKSAFFIYYRLHKKAKNIVIFLIKLLVGVPSVIFGVFAINYLGNFLKLAFNLETSFNLITAFFTLAIMIVPTIIAVVLEALKNTPNDYVNSTVALGIFKTRAIYKIVYKQIFPSIIVAGLLAFGRAIGETMALSMILQSERYEQVFNQGFNAFANSSLSPIGSFISVNIFSDGISEAKRSLLFSFGIALLIIVTVINLFVVFVTRKRSKKNFLSKKVELAILKKKTLMDKFIWSFDKRLYPEVLYYVDNKNKFFDYAQERAKVYKLYAFRNYWKITQEFVAFSFLMMTLFWILGAILVNGLQTWSSPESTLFSYAKNSTGQAFINSLLILFVSILISLPIALIVALYLKEYCEHKKFKNSVLTFLDILGATPSILFGLFGLAFFILTFGLSSSGIKGRSLIAAALTISLVILPNFTRMIYQELNNIPMVLRYNSYALGVSKFKTILTIVLPEASKGILSSVILISGRTMGESAPIYLTAGLSSGRVIGLNQPGQTLTTRIFAQILNNDLQAAKNIMYEAGLLAVILIGILIFVGNNLIPYINKNKKFTFKYLVCYYLNQIKLMNYQVAIFAYKIIYIFANKETKKEKYKLQFESYQLKANEILKTWKK